MSYPDFVCMGFQKCGTTTLYDIFSQHPQMVLCQDVKEPMLYRVPIWHFFGSRFYRWRYFGNIDPSDQRLKGEINAGLTFTHCQKRVEKNYAPETKMIFMLRDPVDRSYSAYKYFLARGFLPRKTVLDDKKYGHSLGFDHYVHMILDNPAKRNKIMKARLHYLVFSQSNYGQCIREYLPAFGRDNMHFIVFEEFIRNQRRECEKVYRFLGVESPEGISYDLQSNEGKERARTASGARRFMFVKGANYCLYDLCAITRWAPGFYRQFQRFYRWIRKGAIVEDTDKGPVWQETRAYLRRYFESDIKATEELSGLPLRKIWRWEEQ